MGVFGVGASFSADKSGDVSKQFIEQGLIALGWTKEEAPSLYNLFFALRTGDIVYLKSSGRQHTSITVKAIGIVRNNTIREKENPFPEHGEVSIIREIAWLTTDQFLVDSITDKYNVRENTIYEEFHPKILEKIIEKIIEKIEKKLQETNIT